MVVKYFGYALSLLKITLIRNNHFASAKFFSFYKNI